MGVVVGVAAHSGNYGDVADWRAFHGHVNPVWRVGCGPGRPVTEQTDPMHRDDTGLLNGNRAVFWFPCEHFPVAQSICHGDCYDWYPKLGFDHREFEPQLRASGAKFCDGVFAGACDTDVPQIMGDRLWASKSKRNLAYWLTLNVHLPVSPNDILETDDCKLGSEQWRSVSPMLCRSYEVHEAVANSIFEEMMRKDFSESDILIVGDHMPPFFQSIIRSRFDSGHVPWLYLENKAAKSRVAKEAMQS